MLAAALPILFLHVRYQPSVSVPLGGSFKLQDFAVLATVLAALAVVRREGLVRLRGGAPLWIASGLLLAWVVAACFYPVALGRSYAWRDHLHTAGEFLWYALLAPAVPLLVRRRADGLLLLAVLTAWTIAASAVGVAQWAGWNVLEAYPPGMRQPSFIGHHDLDALAGMTLATGLLVLLWGVRERRVRAGAWAAIVAGVVGFALGGASAAVIGLVPAVALAASIAARRRLVRAHALAATAAAVALATAGVLGLRAGDLGQFARFVGLQQATPAETAAVQTYSQRTLLAYVGLEIWKRHPLVGAGWQASFDPATVDPVLPAAHRRFPDIAEPAFPTSRHEYGVQILYVQTLADLGLVGVALLAVWFAAPLAAGIRSALRAARESALAATLGVVWLVLALGLWTAVGLVPGLPLGALTWLALGAVALARATPSLEESRA